MGGWMELGMISGLVREIVAGEAWAGIERIIS